MTSWTACVSDEEALNGLTSALGIGRLEAGLLFNRGITTVEAASRYFDPSFDDLHDPFLFAEMEGAVSLVSEAVGRGDRILVHGDYDADGICGAALLYRGLERAGADVHYFVPDRAKDGYGLARRVMKRSVETGLGLVISVDCGASDRDIVAYLRENGIRSIITDHHSVTERIAEADAFLNPKLPGESYPFDELAGVGVAFKLLQGIESGAGLDTGLKGMLDIVALGTLGDYSPLVDENRVLVSLGLERLRRWENVGLDALRTVSGLPAEGFSARQICFTLVPRLNSPGRVGSARDVVRLLVTGDRAEAAGIAVDMEEKNNRRKSLDSLVTEEASYLADVIMKRDDPNALVFSSSSWHEGVVGIGAARLNEKYNLPSVLIAVKDGVGKGSARSSGTIDLKETLERCSKYLLAYGGHRDAGGFTIPEENISDFSRLFNKVVGEEIEEATGHPPVLFDAAITLEECESGLISFMGRMRPFGPGNREPVFMIEGLEALPGTRIVGKEHLRIEARDERGLEASLIGFTLGRAWNPVDIIGRKIDILVNLRMNTWQGREEPQLQVIMIRLHRKE